MISIGVLIFGIERGRFQSLEGDAVVETSK